ncbi:MAG: hypothetical protein ACYDG2_22455 [Ruminiclostridium sp.]
MKRRFKNPLVLALVCAFSLSTVIPVNAVADNKSEPNKTAEYIYDVTYSNGTNSDQQNYNKVTTVKDPTFDGIVDEKGNINVPSKEEMKKRYLEKLNKDPEIYQDNINNIDSIVDETINVIKAEKIKKSNSEVSSSGVVTAGILPQSYWYKTPWVDTTYNGITYSTSWVGFDNYRSSVATLCTYSKSSSTTKSIGFSGDGLFKGFFGFTAAADLLKQLLFQLLHRFLHGLFGILDLI